MRHLIAVLALLAAPAWAEPHRYELDPTHTVVSFTIGHIGYADTLGIFSEVEGAFTYDMETRQLSDLEIRVATPSVNTFNEARDGHVRNADFLDVSAHPVMTFTADGGDPASDQAGSVTGELTLLGITRPLTLDVTLNKAAEYPFGHQRFTLGISATGALNRSDFGMSYGVDNGLVGDQVDIVIETEAMRME
ncbi:MAG: YceI family protein [Pseudomonadota bacterium]